MESKLLRKTVSWGIVALAVAGGLSFAYRSGETKGYKEGTRESHRQVNILAQRKVNFLLENLFLDKTDLVTKDILPDLSPNYDLGAIALGIRNKVGKLHESGRLIEAKYLSEAMGELWGYHQALREISWASEYGR